MNMKMNWKKMNNPKKQKILKTQNKVKVIIMKQFLIMKNNLLKNQMKQNK